MKLNTKLMIASIIFLICLSLMVAAPGSAQEYEALKGAKTIKTIFDFRDGNTETALIHITLILDTYKDNAIRKISNRPDFAVVFMASAVKLLSKNREGFSPEEKKNLDKIDNIISTMLKEGIRLEICLVAIQVFGVDPASVSPDIHRVNNGWISSMGYQTNGYTLVPVY